MDVDRSVRIDCLIDEASPPDLTMEDSSNRDRVFESAAELFAMLATPIRLKIISAVCQQERNVSELLAMIDTTQPNMSQHLATLYRSGVLSKRREGTQIYYRLQSERVATLCRAVCTQVAIELDSGGEIDESDRLVPLASR
jgi:ArsR family transcriptional regulator